MCSRDGFFIFDETRANVMKVAEGKYFGLARAGPKVFLFGFTGEKNTRSNKGGIWSFKFAEGKIFDWKLEVSGLDNGCHQMAIFENHLYIPETYLQRLLRFKIDEEGAIDPSSKEVLNIWKPALINFFCESPDENAEYLHVNALTVQDGRFFFMCPRLGRGGDVDQESTIQVWNSRDWTMIDEYQLGRRFCHDLVVVGHEIYFCDSTNAICKLNLVTREVSDVFRLVSKDPDYRMICRALSISPDMEFLASTTAAHGPAVNFTKSKVFGLAEVNSATYLTRIDGRDYNNLDSSLRRSYVMTLMAKDLDFFKSVLEPCRELFKCASSTEFTEAGRNWFYRAHDTQPPTTVLEFLSPDVDTFSPLEPFINGKEKIVLDGNPDISYQPVLKDSELFTRSGDFFWYPEGHGMGWHTNQLQVSTCPETPFRCYVVKTSGRSFFFYRDPMNGQIRAVHDIDESVNIFGLGAGPCFWHAIGTMSGARLSVGWRCGAQGLRSILNFI